MTDNQVFWLIIGALLLLLAFGIRNLIRRGKRAVLEEQLNEIPHMLRDAVRQEMIKRGDYPR